MRYIFIIATIMLITSCGKDPYICPKEGVLIEECLSNTFANYNYDYYDIDTAYVKGDSILYYIEAPPEYHCANLKFCNNRVYYIGDTLPYLEFDHIIRSGWKSPERVINLFTYDISFLDQYYEGDSIGIRFYNKSTPNWIVYYKR